MKTLLLLCAALTGCATKCLVESEPQGAIISLDGKPVGTAPVQVKFSKSGFAQSYVVRAEAPGYETQSQVVSSHTDVWSRQIEWPTMLLFRLRPVPSR